MVGGGLAGVHAAAEIDLFNKENPDKAIECMVLGAASRFGGHAPAVHWLNGGAWNFLFQQIDERLETRSSLNSRLGLISTFALALVLNKALNAWKKAYICLQENMIAGMKGSIRDIL